MKLQMKTYLLLQIAGLVNILYIFFDFRTGLINFGENGNLRISCQENRKLLSCNINANGPQQRTQLQANL